MGDEKIEFVGRLLAVEFNEGDTLVLMTDERLHPKVKEELWRLITENYTGVKCMILDNGMEVGVLRKGVL